MPLLMRHTRARAAPRYDVEPHLDKWWSKAVKQDGLVSTVHTSTVARSVTLLFASVAPPPSAPLPLVALPPSSAIASPIPARDSNSVLRL